MEESTSDLERFRRQWKEEVSARSRTGKETLPLVDTKESFRSTPQSPKPTRSSIKASSFHIATVPANDEDADNSRADDTHSGMIERIEGLTVRDVDEDEFTARGSSREPRSALEHYERAVEKESQGNLGDSLSHYRKAYRLDAKVDQSYKNKHFPPKSKQGNPNPSNASATVPSTAHHSWKEPESLPSVTELIASFCTLPITGSPPLIEGDQPPPCPIGKLPSEVLLEVLIQVAILDPASFTRLAVVCKRLAYHVCTENKIWKRVALGNEFGLASQLYAFATDWQGRETVAMTLDIPEERVVFNESTFGDPRTQDWREVFHSHPRIRFTGVYISTVNYTRAGGASASQATWNTPVHIVTYYRYLRFFRDGTVISLLTTHEPIDVVHQLTKENVGLARGSGKDQHPLNFTSSAPAISSPPAPTAPPTTHGLMKQALRGRWRLCHASENGDNASNIATGPAGVEGDLHIETDGAGPNYMYTMHLSLKSSARSKHAVKNNKLQWKGFWSYNQLTNDWAEFQLKNDKAFLFSRVKSYGLGY